MSSIVSIHLAVTATFAKRERELWHVWENLGEGKNQEKSAQIVCKFKKIESVLALTRRLI